MDTHVQYEINLDEDDHFDQAQEDVAMHLAPVEDGMHLSYFSRHGYPTVEVSRYQAKRPWI